jgi:membrane protein DedA with SNARE-associated domain
MLETITHLVTNFGYIIVAVLILLECAGFPLPGETALLVAAGFAGAGKLSIALVIAIAAAAAVFGDAGGYWIGRMLGRGFVERWGKYVGLNAEKMKFLEGFFLKHGPPTVFFGRFVSILRTYSALFAGISRMPYLTFTVFNALGGIVWAVVFGVIGYVFGKNLDEVENLVRVFGWGALLGFGVAGAVWYLRRWASSTATQEGVALPGLRGKVIRLIYARAIVSADGKPARISRASVVVLYCIGLGIAVLLIVFVSGTARTLIEYDPLVRFEETISAFIDAWLSARQSLIVLYVAKFGSALSLAVGAVTALVSFATRQRLAMFSMVFGMAGGETLNVLLAFLNRGPVVSASRHVADTVGALLAFDNIIVPCAVFGMLAYFAVKRTKFALSAASVIAGLGLPPLAVVTCNFFGGLHGGIEFFEELLCAVVWLWICIGLMEFVRVKWERQALLRKIAENP